jgi:hypothetical protein
LKAPSLILVLLAGNAHASSDGELAWTNLSFCNAAQYCIDISSSKTAEIEQIRIRHNGTEIAVPGDVTKHAGSPLLNQVRFVNIFRKDRRVENHLEIPLVLFHDDGGSSRSVLTIIMVDDVVTMTKLVEPGTTQSVTD